MPPSRLPDHLLAPWASLPRRAVLAHRRLGPPALHATTRPAAWCLWLLALSVMRAQGRVLAHGSATLTLGGPCTPWPRRIATLGVGALAVAAAMTAMTLPGAAAIAAHTVLPMPFWLLYLLAFAPTAVLATEALRMIWHARRALPAARALRALRADGSTWWEAATLVVDEHEPLSAGRLVGAALAHADSHRIGIAAIPATPAVQRAYQRRGFRPWPGDPRILYRAAAG
ncbi:hypothetical protein AB0N09_28210 [Streptomyces erythrochromogenes]|uniref:hypothetical protein n=1 Tax=Streptomyces erythrochromogenes TaxID=285574 RepID=UPI003412C7B2